LVSIKEESKKGGVQIGGEGGQDQEKGLGDEVPLKTN